MGKQRATVQDPPHWELARYLQATGLPDKPVDQVYKEMMGSPGKFDFALDHYHNGKAKDLNLNDYKKLYFAKNGVPFEPQKPNESVEIRNENKPSAYPTAIPYADISAQEMDAKAAMAYQDLSSPQSSTFLAPINLGLPKHPSEDKNTPTSAKEEAFRRYKEERAYTDVVKRRQTKDGTLDVTTPEDDLVLRDSSDPYQKYRIMSYETFGENWDKTFNQIPYKYQTPDGKTYDVELAPNGGRIRKMTDESGNDVDWNKVVPTESEQSDLINKARVANMGEYKFRYTARGDIKNKAILASNHLVRNLKAKYGDDVIERVISSNQKGDISSVQQVLDDPNYQQLLQMETLAENSRKGQMELIKQDEFRQVAREFDQRKLAQARADDLAQSQDDVIRLFKAPARIIENTLFDMLSGIGEIGEAVLGEAANMPGVTGATSFLKVLQAPDDMLEKYNPNPSNINRDVISNTSKVEVKGKKYQLDFNDDGSEIRAFRDENGFVINPPDLTKAEYDKLLETKPSLQVNGASFYSNGAQVVSDLLLPIGLAGKTAAFTKGLGLTANIGKQAGFYGSLYAQQYHHSFEEGMNMYADKQKAHKYAGYSAAMITASGALFGIEGSLMRRGAVEKMSSSQMVRALTAEIPPPRSAAIQRVGNMLSGFAGEGAQEPSENYTNALAAYLVDGRMTKIDNLQLLNDFTMGGVMGLFGGATSKVNTERLTDYHRRALAQAVSNPIDYEQTLIAQMASDQNVPYNRKNPLSPDEAPQNNPALGQIKKQAQEERQFLERVGEQYTALKDDLPEGTDHDRVISTLFEREQIKTKIEKMKAMGMEESQTAQKLIQKEASINNEISQRISAENKDDTLEPYVGSQIEYEGQKGELVKDGNQYYVDGETRVRLPIEAEEGFEMNVLSTPNYAEALKAPKTMAETSPNPEGPDYGPQTVPSDPDPVRNPEQETELPESGMTVNTQTQTLSIIPDSWVKGVTDKLEFIKGIGKEFKTGKGPGGDLPRSVWDRNVFKKGNIDAEIDKASYTQKKLAAALKESGLNYENVSSDIRAALKNPELNSGGQIDIGGKPASAEVRAALLEIRQHTDALSKLLMESNITSGPIKATIDDNIGLYWTRSYQVHSDPEWIDKASAMTKMTDEEFGFYKTLLQEDIDFYENRITLLQQDPENDTEVAELQQELDAARVDLAFTNSNPDIAKNAGRLGLAAEIIRKQDAERDQKLAQKEQDLQKKKANLISSGAIQEEIDTVDKTIENIQAERTKIARRDPVAAVVKTLNKQQKKPGQKSGSMTYSPAGIFKKKKRIPAAYRFAMGEFEDPMVVYAQTVYKQAFANYSWAMEGEILKAGLASGKISPQETGKISYPVTLAREDVFITPEIGKALDMINSTVEHGGFSQAIYTLIAAVKMGKTVLNPIGQIRNMVSGDAFHWASGRAFYTGKPEISGLAAYSKLAPGALFQKPFDRIKKNQGLAESLSDQAYQAAFSEAFGYSNPEIHQLREELLRMGVIGENLALNEIRELLGGVSNKQNAQILGQILEQPGMAGRILDNSGIKMSKIGDTLKFMTTLYQASDDYHRALAYLKTKAINVDILTGGRQLAPGEESFIEDWASEEAAKEARGIYPTYSEIPLVLQRFRKQVPVVGPFVNFSAEVIRTQLENFKRMRSELGGNNRVIESLREERHQLKYQESAFSGEEKKNIQEQIAQIDHKLTYLESEGVVNRTKKRGRARRWGIITYYLSATAGIEVLQHAISATGLMGGADADDFYSFLPPWTQRGSYLITHLNRETGDYTYIDLSSIIPTAQMTYGLGKLAGVAMTEDETAEARITEGLMSILEPITSGDLLTKSTIEAIANTRQLGSGREITTEDGLRGAKDRITYIAKQSQPGFVDLAGRIYKAAFDPQKDYYGSYDLGTELASLSGIRPSTSNVSEAFFWNCKDGVAEIGGARYIINREANKQKYKHLSDRSLKEQLKETYDRANMNYKAELIKMHKQYLTSLRLGQKSSTLLEKMVDAGVSKDDRWAIQSGVYPDLEVKRSSK